MSAVNATATHLEPSEIIEMLKLLLYIVIIYSGTHLAVEVLRFKTEMEELKLLREAKIDSIAAMFAEKAVDLMKEIMRVYGRDVCGRSGKPPAVAVASRWLSRPSRIQWLMLLAVTLVIALMLLIILYRLP